MAVTTGADSGATFSLEEEDHTLANALRFLLNKKCAAASLVTVKQCCFLPFVRDTLHMHCYMHLFSLIGMTPMQPACVLRRLQHPAPVRAHGQPPCPDHRCVRTSALPQWVPCGIEMQDICWQSICTEAREAMACSTMQ